MPWTAIFSTASRPRARPSSPRCASGLPRATCVYRALEAVGERAADEALIALRLVIAGQRPDDDAVRRLRGLAALVRRPDPAAQAQAFANTSGTLSDLSELRASPLALAAAARAAYAATF